MTSHLETPLLVVTRQIKMIYHIIVHLGGHDISYLTQLRCLATLPNLCLPPMWSIRPFYPNPKFGNTFVILCESRNVMIMAKKLDITEKTSQKWRHIETMFADTIILWITIYVTTQKQDANFALSIHAARALKPLNTDRLNIKPIAPMS